MCTEKLCSGVPLLRKSRRLEKIRLWQIFRWLHERINGVKRSLQSEHKVDWITEAGEISASRICSKSGAISQHHKPAARELQSIVFQIPNSPAILVTCAYGDGNIADQLVKFPLHVFYVVRTSAPSRHHIKVHDTMEELPREPLTFLREAEPCVERPQ
ncbi:hypothetical protein BaRGS_00010206 [Batillaria attramentaria]|uniref:Uncharacterized protein n=1 Tax=Batillaria attramentaria TaxID=370345 RepID=A0ABD0LH24_9CAEN